MDETYQAALEDIKNTIKIQCADGNWNYDPYMHGLANGLLLAKSFMERKDFTALQAPKVWGRDKENKNEQPVVVKVEKQTIDLGPIIEDIWKL